MKKGDLKTGMRVRLRKDDKLYLVIKNYTSDESGHHDVIFVGFDGGCWYGKLYTDNLKNRLDELYDVMRVYSVCNEEYHPEGKLLDKNSLSLLWKRCDPKKLTIKQIEERLGYEIELVS